MRLTLEGSVAWVTGAAAGLGQRITQRFAEAGAKGLAFDVAELSRALPPGWFGQRGDVADEAGLARAIAKIENSFGRLDIVVANAGVVPPWCSIDAMDFEHWDEVFAVNVKGVAATIKQAVPLMKENGGSIIATASLNAYRGHAGQCLYTATKHAVLGIVRAAAQDLGRYGIRVNAVAPGPIPTDALVGRLAARAKDGGLTVEEARSQYDAETALGRMASEDDVAGTALFLASDLSAGVSGQFVPIDAGLR